MNDAMTWLVVAGLVFAALAMLAITGLKGWQAWLELKRLELASRRGAPGPERIEMADLRERVRKLEAIASCVDL